MRRRAAVTAEPHNHDHDYSSLLSALSSHFGPAVDGADVLFQTDADERHDLFSLYLDGLPGERQVHNCNCCARFIETYGGLVAVDPGGALRSVMWSGDVPGFYGHSFRALQSAVEGARVSGVFYAKEAVWGTPHTGTWSHLAVAPPARLVFRERGLTPFQAAAAVKENRRHVATALGEFKPALLDEALRILRADAVARAERFVAPLQWLRDLHDRPRGTRGENVLWRAVATAPEGYCHPRAAMTGSLLEDIAAGLPFADIQRRFNAKMHPLKYQRPQAPPSAGNIKAAEALVEKMGIQRSLERRFARLDELRPLWLPRPEPKPTGEGVFAHLAPKSRAAPAKVQLPAQNMTWVKFEATVLDGADRIEQRVPGSGNFVALTSALYADAPPILKWDREEDRNPLAWYLYHGSSPARQWRLAPDTWTPVTAITRGPTEYGAEPMPFLGNGIVIVLAGAGDTGMRGNALFPECLREDLHAVRATIEAYSKAATLHGLEEASACGYLINPKHAGVRLRVHAHGAHADYLIDRWD